MSISRKLDQEVPDGEVPDGAVPDGEVIAAPGIRSGRRFPTSLSIPLASRGKVGSRGEDRVLLGFRIPGSVGLADAGATPVSAIVLRYKG